MKKFLVITFLLITVISFSSYTTKNSYKPLTGSFAPKITLSGEEKNLVNFQENGLTLVHFWASYDANSRINNLRFNQLAKEREDIAFVSIAMENYQSVFDATLKTDGLSTENHYRETLQSEISNLYKLNENGFGSFLVNRQGVIIAQNISAEGLQQLLSN